MVDIASQKMQNAALSDCRSFGSSRFPKVSIGITVDKSSKIGPGLRTESAAVLPNGGIPFIAVDKCSKIGPGLRTESAAVLPNGGIPFSCKGAEGTTRRGNVETLERNGSDEFEIHEPSARFSTRYDRNGRIEAPAAETVKFFVDGGSALQSEDGPHKKLDYVATAKRRGEGGNVERVETAAFSAMHEMQLEDKRNTIEEPEQTAKFTERKVNTVDYRKKRDKGGVGRTKEAALSTKRLVDEENDKVPEKMAKCSNEDLKMKLWEILGTTASENKHTVNSPSIMDHKENMTANQSRGNQSEKASQTKLNLTDINDNKENLNTNQSRECKNGKAAKGKLIARGLEENKKKLNVQQSSAFWKGQKGKAARAKQNSDTIETDSESPTSNQVMRRPVTRSLTRKKAPPKRIQKLQGDISCEKKPLSSSNCDFRRGKENIFTFDEVEGKAGSLCYTSSDHSNGSEEKINDPEKAKTQPPKSCFAQSIQEKSLHNSDREQALLSPDNPSQQSKRKGNSSVPHQGKKLLSQTVDCSPSLSFHSHRAVQLNIGSLMRAYNRKTRENTDSPLLQTKNHSWGHENSPPEPKNALLHDDIASGSMERQSSQSDYCHSPTLAADTTPSSPGVPHDEVFSGPVAARHSKPITENCSSTDLGYSIPGSCEPEEADTECSDDTRGSHNPGDMESPLLKGAPQKQKFSLFPKEEQDTESEADDPMSQGFGLADKWFPVKGSPKKPPISCHPTKRVRSLNNDKRTKANSPSSPISTSRTEEIVGPEILDQFPEGSSRCIAQLALVLERFKRRVKSQTTKRISEILSAAGDKIRHQLQGVESQILADVGKFNNIGKSKRKRLESRFYEQQEKLKLIHDKFKEDVNQHLLDCRTTLEELKAYNMALKETADRQKASHKKVLQQAGESMEAQIDDAETSIAAVHKGARKKMAGLKRALKEWMD